MATYLYLSLIPQTLIASMFPPEEFGLYFAVGSAKRSRGQAIFVPVDRDKIKDGPFPFSEVDERCVPHPDSSPKTSV